MITTQPPRSAHLLVVDDDEALRTAVARGLTKAGYVVAEACDGAQALERAREEPPDAAVLDVLLPDSGGLGVARQIRSQRGLQGLPILFVTALSPAAVRDTLFPAPVLYKPFTYRQLVASVRELVRDRPTAG